MYLRAFPSEVVRVVFAFSVVLSVCHGVVSAYGRVLLDWYLALIVEGFIVQAFPSVHKLRVKPSVVRINPQVLSRSYREKAVVEKVFSRRYHEGVRSCLSVSLYRILVAAHLEPFEQFLHIDVEFRVALSVKALDRYEQRHNAKVLLAESVLYSVVAAVHHLLSHEVEIRMCRRSHYLVHLCRVGYVLHISVLVLKQID